MLAGIVPVVVVGFSLASALALYAYGRSAERAQGEPAAAQRQEPEADLWRRLAAWLVGLLPIRSQL